MLVFKTATELKDAIVSILPDVDALTRRQLASILRTYGLFADHFTPWMNRAATSALSPQGRDACRDNLRCEIVDDHPGMLRQFLTQITMRNGGKRTDRCQPWIRMLDDQSSLPVAGVAIMAGLEVGSLVFIPWMKEAAAKLKLKNLQYLEVHGETDIAHADAFEVALRAECVTLDQQAGAGASVERVSMALMLVFALLREIFKVMD